MSIPPIESSIMLAIMAHDGQKDKAGELYIYHPMRVMLGMPTLAEKTVAILHDVVEDTDVDLKQLRVYGYSDAIIDAIDAITKRKGEVYFEYLDRVIANKIALSVKLQDMNDNRARVAHLPQSDRLRLTHKYIMAFNYIQSKIDTLGKG